MPSSYSTDLKIELMVTGENAGTWGNKTNTNLNLVQQAIGGYQSVSIAGGAQTTALAMTDATISNARNMVIEFTGAITGNQIVTIPNGIQKNYILKNSTTGAFTVTFKYASVGTGITLTQGYLTAVYGDGSEIYRVDLDTLTGNIATNQLENLSVTSAKLASFAVTSARIASYAITSAKLNTNAVTGIKITQSTITQSKLASNSVGADQLIATAVTAGNYTRATITVDADGRITSASAGGASNAGMGIPKQYSVGPTSGTYTANPAANRIGVYMYAGGGGSGGTLFYQENPLGGAGGGSGGFGFYNKPITQPFSQPFSVGGGGNTGNSSSNSGGPGGAGGATTIANVGTVNGGNGGAGGAFGPVPPGNTGTAPGAALTYPVGAKPLIINETYGNPSSYGALLIFENIGT